MIIHEKIINLCVNWVFWLSLYIYYKYSGGLIIKVAILHVKLSKNQYATFIV